MNSTEPSRANELAQSLFDDIVAPLAQSRREAGLPEYFPRTHDASAASYFEPASITVMRPEDFEFPGGGDCSGLVDALESYWHGQGESGLAALCPRLKEIGAALRDEVKDSDGSVDILCYTMF